MAYAERAYRYDAYADVAPERVRRADVRAVRTGQRASSESNAALLVLALIGSTTLPVRAWERLSGRVDHGAAVALRTVGVTVILLLSIAFLVGDSYNPFLYFRF